PELGGRIVTRATDSGSALVLGAVRRAEANRSNQYRNSVLWVGPGGELVDAFDKTVAVPGIEAGAFPVLQPGLDAVLVSQSATPRVELGQREKDLRGSFSIAPAVCFEVIYPGLVAARRAPDTRVLVNFANDRWARRETASRQQIAYGSFRAIEQRLWLVRAAGGGISAVVDPWGRVVEQLEFDREGTLVAEVRPWAGSRGAERAALGGLLLGGCGLGFGLGRWLERRGAARGRPPS
ncbi:MAG: hypothetical protein MJE66_21065, partial [Proteobacteria bacterium]|nr:hypothetical protein [Pseudomonadota bacterium]